MIGPVGSSETEWYIYSMKSHPRKLCASNFVETVYIGTTYQCDAWVSKNFWPHNVILAEHNKSSAKAGTKSFQGFCTNIPRVTKVD